MGAAAQIDARIIFTAPVSKPAPEMFGLQKAMLDATPDCIKVVSVTGTLLMMNRAGCRALGVPEDSLFGMRWLGLLPPEVHELGEEALAKAAAGEPARFPGKSISDEGISYWDNLLTPVLDETGEVMSILCVSRDVTEKTILERELTSALSREKLLSREMGHRIKNLFSIVTGLVAISEKEAALNNLPAAALPILREKLRALSRASDAAFSTGDIIQEDAKPIDLGAVISSVLRPYGERCHADGETASIRRDAMTTFALVLHELATNSVKYGGLSSFAGTVTLNWTKCDQWLKLRWVEAGGPPILSPPERVGFGSEMVDRIVRMGGGQLTRSWHADGFVAELLWPHSAAA